jgi:hypothetical protein
MAKPKRQSKPKTQITRRLIRKGDWNASLRAPSLTPGSLSFSNAEEIHPEERHDTGEPKIEIEEHSKEEDIYQLQDDHEHVAIIGRDDPESKSQRSQP